MFKKRRILGVVTAVLITVSSLSLPALAANENQLSTSTASSNFGIETTSWSMYLNIAKKYGCTFNVEPSQRAAFCRKVSLPEFESMIKEQYLKISATASVVTQLTTTDENSLKTTFAATLAATTATTTQKVWSGSSALGPTLFLRANITATYYNSTNTFKSCDAVNSSITGLTLGFSYVQTSYSSNISSTKKTLTVTVYGTETAYIFLEGIGNFLSFQVYRTYVCSL